MVNRPRKPWTKDEVMAAKWLLIWAGVMVALVAIAIGDEILWHQPQARLSIRASSPSAMELSMQGDDGVFWNLDRSEDGVNWRFIPAAYMTNGMHLVVYETNARAIYRLSRSFVLIGTNPPPIY